MTFKKQIFAKLMCLDESLPFHLNDNKGEEKSSIILISKHCCERRKTTALVTAKNSATTQRGSIFFPSLKMINHR